MVHRDKGPPKLRAARLNVCQSGIYIPDNKRQKRGCIRRTFALVDLCNSTVKFHIQYALSYDMYNYFWLH